MKEDEEMNDWAIAVQLGEERGNDYVYTESHDSPAWPPK